MRRGLRNDSRTPVAISPGILLQTVAWVLYSRRGCHLCEAAEDLLEMLRPGVMLVDVDADPATRDRYGLRVPVLEIDGVPMVEGRFDETEVARLVARG